MEAFNFEDELVFEQIIQEETAATMQVKKYVEKYIETFKNSKCFEINKLNVDLGKIHADHLEKTKEWQELTSKNAEICTSLKTTLETKINELIKLKSRQKELQDETYKQIKLLEEKKSNFEEARAICEQTQQTYINNLDMFIKEKGDSADNSTVIVTFRSHEHFPLEFSIKAGKVVDFDAGKLKIDPQTKAQLEDYLRRGNSVMVLCKLRQIIIKT